MSLFLFAEKMESLQELMGSGKSVDFLLDAVKTVIDVTTPLLVHTSILASRAVCQCRRGLKWSYAFGFYLDSGSRQKTLFEQDQVLACLLVVAVLASPVGLCWFSLLSVGPAGEVL